MPEEKATVPVQLLERIDLDVQDSKKEIDRLWKVVGSTREELIALRGDTKQINDILQDFRAEVKEATDKLSATNASLSDALGAMGEGISHDKGRRAGIASYCRTSILIAGVLVAAGGLIVSVVGAMQ